MGDALPINLGWVVLVVTLFFATFGLGYGLALLVYLLAFLFGGLLVIFYYGKLKSDETYGVSRHFPKVIAGIPSVLRAMAEDQLPGRLDRRLTGASKIDELLQEVIEYLLRDYLYDWYGRISTDPRFPHEVNRMLHSVIVTFASRAKNVDWMPYFTTTLVDEVASHIKLYRRAEEKLESEPKSEISREERLLQYFFDLETEMEGNACRDLISTSRECEKQYLRDIAEALLYLLLPEKDFESKLFRFLCRELLVTGVFLPAVDKITDPDYINQYIIWMCEEGSLTSESFISAVKMCESSAELDAVEEKVDEAVKGQRSKDTGGSDDVKVKQKLSSLQYVRKVCASQRRFIQKVADQSGAVEDIDRLLTAKSAKRHLPFLEVLRNPVGAQYFNDYLANVGAEMYLNCLYDTEFFSAMVTKQDADGVMSQDDNDNDSAVTALEIYNKHFGPDVPMRNRPQLDQALCDGIKGQLDRSEVTADIFEGISAKLLERLEVLYEDFRLDTLYISLLRELDLDTDSITSSLDDQLMDDGSSVSSEHAISAVTTDTSIPTGGLFTLAIQITQSEVVKEKSRSFAVYRISVSRYRMVAEARSEGSTEERSEVSSEVEKNQSVDSWETNRRYSDFHDLHQMILEKFPSAGSVSFPSKKTFNNMNKEFLVKRAAALDLYLSTQLQPTRLESCPGLFVILHEFLQEGPWEAARPKLTRMIVNPLRQSVRSMGTKVKLVPDFFMNDFIDGVGKVFKMQTSASRTHLESNKVRAGLDPEDEDNIPVRILLLMMDEVFDLKKKNQWLRRRMVAILRQIVKATFGDRINRRIVEQVETMTSADQVAEYIRLFRDSFWPGGVLAAPAIPRDPTCKLRTQTVCKAKMLGSISDEVRHLIGSETSRKGVQRVFRLLQRQELNRRLFYVVLEGAIQELFPENTFKKAFRAMNSHSKRIRRDSRSEQGAGFYDTGLVS